MSGIAAIQPCLWFDDQAREAMEYYVDVFPDSRIVSIDEYPDEKLDEHFSGMSGKVLNGRFTLNGVDFVCLDGGPMFKHSEAFSFQIETRDQKETDRYWNAIVGNGGQESMCGWCKDKWGISWQITPRVLTDVMTGGDKDAAKRAFEAMMSMKKIDVAAIEAAIRGDAVGAA